MAGQQPSLYQRTMMMESPEVTRIAIDALRSGKASVVPGFMNALPAASTRRMPRQLAAHERGAVYADMKAKPYTEESISAIARRPITSTPSARGYRSWPE